MNPDTATYVGHATVLVDLDGTRLLTDPVLRPRIEAGEHIAETQGIAGTGDVGPIVHRDVVGTSPRHAVQPLRHAAMGLGARRPRTEGKLRFHVTQERLAGHLTRG